MISILIPIIINQLFKYYYEYLILLHITDYLPGSRATRVKPGFLVGRVGLG